MNRAKNDRSVINNISYSVESANVTITIVKNDLDASLFTLNKEYIINDPVHDSYAGHYILLQVKQLFIKQNENFIMSTVLKFKKSTKE